MSPGVFNPASVSALLSTGASLIGGMGAWVLGYAPDWDDVKPLAWVGFTGALTAACSFTATLDVPAAAYVWTSRVQVLAIALHLAAWYAYFRHWGARRSSAGRWALLAPLVAAGALALVPGFVRGDAVTLRPVPWLGLVYHDPVVTAPGYAVYAVLALYGLAGIAALVSLGRRRLPFPRTHLAVAAALLGMGVHDVVVVLLAAPTPSLLDFALYGPAVVIAAFTLRRVVQTATDLRRLRTGLEVAVVEQTAALKRSQAALAAAERVAALGQLSAGFAHEVTEPATVVSACLDALARELPDDQRGHASATLQNARAALGRITALARQLLLAGRASGSPPQRLIEVRVGRAVDAALAAGRACSPANVALEGAVPPGLTVLGDEEGLVQVLSSLVLNAIQAIPPGRPATVHVRAQAAAERVRIVVEGDGAGMSEAALLHAFEPFYGAKGAGSGMGLGLAVSRRLVEAMHGTVRFESALGGGTKAFVELARGAPDASEADLPAALLAAPRRARVLIVEDDVQTLRAVVKLVSAEHEVNASKGVTEALAELAERSFDLVLCEVTLSTGGAERFWEELLLRAPEMQGRVVFMKGGEATPAARAFLARQPQPVLEKPFGLADVQDVMERLGITPASEPPQPARRPPAAENTIARVRRT